MLIRKAQYQLVQIGRTLLKIYLKTYQVAHLGKQPSSGALAVREEVELREDRTWQHLRRSRLPDSSNCYLTLIDMCCDGMQQSRNYPCAGHLNPGTVHSLKQLLKRFCFKYLQRLRGFEKKMVSKLSLNKLFGFMMKKLPFYFTTGKNWSFSI